VILIEKTPEKTIYCADAAEVYSAHKIDPHLLIFDPPWESIPMFQFSESSNVLAFCDGRRMGDVVRVFGAPTWVFAWDCVSCWFTPNRPLQRVKYCAWFGDVAQYNQEASRYGCRNESPRVVRNSRSEYLYEPATKKLLADLYAEPITRLHSAGHRHGKPVEWIKSLVSAVIRPGDVVLDPFAGGGSSLAAALAIGIPWVGGDIDGDLAEQLSDIDPYHGETSSLTGSLF
jgi:hypothetical protein